MKNNRNSNGEVLLAGVADKLRNSRTLAPNVPYEIHDFCDYLAQVSDNKEILPIGMIITLTCALDDLKRERCGFAKKVDFPKVLIEEKYQIVLYLSWFPLIVDSFGNEEFAKEFRILFEQNICKPQPAVEKQEDFGVKVVEENYVDISNKDKAAVLAALYNASHPHGMGFLQYDSKPMTIEEARELLQQTQEFDYLKGRVMKVNLQKSDHVYVGMYNRDNGKGAAEKAISGCSNIS